MPLSSIRLGIFKAQVIITVPSFPAQQLEEIKSGGKVVMPQNVLNRTTRRNNLPSPFIYKVTNGSNELYCGAITFDGQNGQVGLTNWMLSQLKVKAGDKVILHLVIEQLQIGKKVKVQPQSMDFLDISDHKAVLEHSLRNFACITPGDLIDILYNGKKLQILIKEAEPNQTISIVDCDLEVDFELPPDYVEPEQSATASDKQSVSSSEQAKETLIASLQRLDGKALTEEQKTTTEPPKRKRGLPDKSYQPGMLSFRNKRIKQKVASEQQWGSKD